MVYNIRFLSEEPVDMIYRKQLETGITGLIRERNLEEASYEHVSVG